MANGDSAMVGDFTMTPGSGVSPVSFHLSYSAPERTPAQSVARAMASVVCHMES